MRRATLLLLFAAPATALLGNLFPDAVVRLRSGKSISLFGSRGPPVAFSSGLYGLMPRRLYTDLFAALTGNVTLVVLNDPTPVTATVVEEAADAIGVDRVGFLAHSAFDDAVLRSPRVHRAVLCDPVATPRWLGWGAASNAPRADLDLLVVKAERAYDASSTTPLPDFLFPELPGGAVVETAVGVGHADVLDDRWADLAPRLLPWMRGAERPTVGFDEWSRRRRITDPTTTRAAYRAWLAERIVQLMC